MNSRGPAALLGRERKHGPYPGLTTSRPRVECSFVYIAAGVCGGYEDLMMSVSELYQDFVTCHPHHCSECNAASDALHASPFLRQL